MQVEVVVVEKVLQCNFLPMKNIFPLFVLFLFSCSTAKQFNSRWIGKTDQDVVNEFGIPDSVYTTNESPKVYLYNFKFKTKEEEAELAKSPQAIVKKIYNNDGRMMLITEKKFFFFNSLNKVIKTEYFDTSYLSKGNIYRRTY